MALRRWVMIRWGIRGVGYCIADVCILSSNAQFISAIAGASSARLRRRDLMGVFSLCVPHFLKSLLLRIVWRGIAWIDVIRPSRYCDYAAHNAHNERECSRTRREKGRCDPDPSPRAHMLTVV
jgi:hypothetical protein